MPKLCHLIVACWAVWGAVAEGGPPVVLGGAEGQASPRAADRQADSALAERIIELERQLAKMQAAMDEMQRQVQTQPRALAPTRPIRSAAGQAAAQLDSRIEPDVRQADADGDSLAAEIDRRIEAYLERRAAEPGASSVWDRLENDLRVYGQIRVRQETDFERIDGPTRNRQRLRLRLGTDYQVDPELKIGGRITTGDRRSSLEPVDRGGAPLSYQDTGDVFDKFEINLDRLYATYSPACLPGAWLSVGKFKHPVVLNPIFDSPVGDLVWDEAAHPEGITAGYTLPGVLGLDKLSLVVGESAVLELSNLDDSSLFFTQLWAERQLGCRWKLAGGVTFYNWENLNPDGDTTLSFQNNFGNAVIAVGPDPEDVIFASEFQILNPLVVLTYHDPDGCSCRHPIQFAYETFHNFGSFDSDRDFGYTVGAAYGPAISSQERGAWYVYYAWVDVQQESVFTPVAQDDFLRATNFRGHMVGVAYFFLNRAELRLSFLSDTPLDPITGSDETEWRGRLDLTVSF